MPDTINFLKERRKKLTKVDQQDRRFLIISLAGFGIVVVIFLISLGVSLWLGSQVSSLKTDQANLKKSVLSQENVEESYLLFVNKLKTLTLLFDQRSDKQQAINYFTNLFGPQVLIKQINYQAEDGILSFGLQAEDVFVLEQAFGQLASSEVAEKFGQTQRSDLRRGEDGQYQVVVTITLVKNKGAGGKPVPAGAGTAKK